MKYLILFIIFSLAIAFSFTQAHETSHETQMRAMGCETDRHIFAVYYNNCTYTKEAMFLTAQLEEQYVDMLYYTISNILLGVIAFNTAYSKDYTNEK